MSSSGIDLGPTLQTVRRGYTRGVAVGLGITLSVGGLAWLTGAQALYVLAVLALALLVAAAIDDPRLTGLSVTVEAPQRVRLGETVTHRFTVTNTGRRRTSHGHVRSHAHGYDDVSLLLPSLAPGEFVQLEVRRTAVARTYVTGSVLVVSSSAPVGMRWAVGHVLDRGSLVVHPQLTRPGLVRLEPGPTAGELGLPVLRRDGDTVHGVRDWRTGDDARQIHWRSTARRGALTVLERESVHQPRVVFLAVGPSTDPAFEAWVSTLATSALDTIRRGAAVTLVAAQHGLWPLTDATPDTALDWCSALGEVTAPDERVLQEAARLAGLGGRVYVCGPAAAAAGPGWSRAAVAYGAVLEPLRTVR